MTDFKELERRLRSDGEFYAPVEAADAIAALRAERDSRRKSSDGLARTAAELRIAYTDALVRAEAAEAALADARAAIESALDYKVFWNDLEPRLKAALARTAQQEGGDV